MTATATYTIPRWAVDPPSPNIWKLLEIKNGIITAEHVLNQRYILVGRAQECVDIWLAHESCSRYHARFAFDQSGTLWLRDLGSTHGTMVNKKTLPSQSIGKEESTSSEPGTRGVIVFPGDVIQFGASTRLFCLEGPTDCVRSSKPIHNGQVVTASEIKESCKNMNQGESISTAPTIQDDFVSWGIDTDHTDESNIALEEQDVPQQFKKDWEQIQALRYKLSNLRLESERIRSKTDLSTGQQRQLERNEQREEEIQNILTEKERDIYRKIYPEQSISNVAKQNFEDDDVNDTTKGADDADIFAATETEESLRAKWSDLQARRIKVMGDVALARKRVAELLDAKPGGDAEDMFFRQNECALATEACGALENEIIVLEGSLALTAKLLKAANSRIHVDLESGYIGEAPMSPARAPPTQNVDVAVPSSIQEMNPPKSVAQSSKRVSDAIQTRITGEESSQSPIKRRRHVKPSALYDDTHARSTLSGLQFAGSIDAQEKSEASQLITEKVQQSGMIDRWQAPKDQDGSGRSKLNEKFAGRY